MTTANLRYVGFGLSSQEERSISSSALPFASDLDLISVLVAHFAQVLCQKSGSVCVGLGTQMIKHIPINWLADETSLYDAAQTFANLPSLPISNAADSDDVEFRIFDSRENKDALDLAANSWDAGKIDLVLVNEGVRAIVGFCSNRWANVPMVQHLPNLVAQILTRYQYSSDLCFDAVTWLMPAEKNLIERDFNGPICNFPPGCVHELFETQANATPERHAIKFGEETLTYRQLDLASNQLAQFLIESGMTPGTRVALLLNRSIDVIVSIIAVMKAGGVYVPLDPTFPTPRLKAIVDDCQPSLILTHGGLESRLPDFTGRFIDISDEVAKISRPPTSRMPKLNRQKEAIYIIYTSGSTGKPKGIEQTHEAISNLIHWQNNYTAIDFTGNVLQFSSICFDVHIQEIFSTLSQGGCICLVKEEDRIDPKQLRAMIERESIATAFLSVSTLTNLFAEVSLPASLKDIITAGEQLIIGANLERFLRSHPDARLHNHYGVSESHVVTALTISGTEREIPKRPTIGSVIANCRIRILDDKEQTMPIGAAGLVWIAGPCLAKHYLNNPEKNSECFHWRNDERWYKTGDLARWRPNGTIEFMGRIDDQVKIAGHLVELGDIESSILKLDAIKECAVVAKSIDENGQQLFAYFTANDVVSPVAIRQQLSINLPSFMIPFSIQQVVAMPLGLTGKIDRAAISKLDKRLDPLSLDASQVSSSVGETDGVMEEIAHVLTDVSGIKPIPYHTPFFDLGISSLHIIKAAGKLSERLKRNISPVLIFQNPSLISLSLALQGSTPREIKVKAAKSMTGKLAIVGMSGRFPGANNVSDLWQKVLAGDDMLTLCEDEVVNRALLLPGESRDGQRVKRQGLIDHFAEFDAEFFKMSPKEALWTDPQQRLFLEIAWEALEDAGLIPGSYPGKLGVFAGSAESAYLGHVAPQITNMTDHLAAIIGNDKDFLATRVAYRFDLKGPAMTVQTGCSTGLVALHQACRAIQVGDCDAAIVGAVSLQVPQTAQHFHEAGSIYSPDGITRPFDEAASGTNMTNGGGCVVIKHLDDAIADRDQIYAVILGTAINNDGSRKAGYTAPSHVGQSEAIDQALINAGISAAEVDYIEAHGTATQLGDPIELNALTEVFRKTADQRQSPCLLGSVKGNIGHLNRAAGISALIKTAKVLESRLVPAMAHFQKLNRQLDLDEKLFRIPKEARKIQAKGRHLHAGVSSFGIGGTNVHAILQEPPLREEVRSADVPPYLITLSGNDYASALRKAQQMATLIDENPDINLTDLCYTLALGRSAHAVRLAVVGNSAAELATALHQVNESSCHQAVDHIKLAFIFPGQGAQTKNLGTSLYANDSIFRQAFDEVALCIAKLPDPPDIAKLLFDPATDGSSLDCSREGQLALFAVEYSLAKRCIELGIRPSVLLGHSSGMYAAACISGIFSVSDAVKLVEARGRLMDTIAPKGGMLNVNFTHEDAMAVDRADLLISAMNSRAHAVFSGSHASINEFAQQLTTQGVSCRRLNNKNPNHSLMMRPMANSFREVFKGLQLHAPVIPIISDVSGDYLSNAQAIDPEYWISHVESALRFDLALDRLQRDGMNVLLEVGPRKGLATLANFHYNGKMRTISALPEVNDPMDEGVGVLEAIGKLWESGVQIRWQLLTTLCHGRKIRLPTHPFNRKQYFIPMPERVGSDATVHELPTVEVDPTRWLQRGLWKRSPTPIGFEAGDLSGKALVHLICGPSSARNNDLAKKLVAEGHKVWTSVQGKDFSCVQSEFSLDFSNGSHLQQLVKIMAEEESLPDVVVYVGWNDYPGASRTTALGDLISLHKALRRQTQEDCSYWIVTLHGKNILTSDHGNISARILSAFALVAPQEHNNIRCRTIDLDNGDEVSFRLLSEMAHGDDADEVGYRKGQRYIFATEPLSHSEGAKLVPRGRYLISGGLGEVGMKVCIELALRCSARICILGRTAAKNLESKIHLIQSYGAEVLYMKGDVSCIVDVERAVAAADQKWGGLDGVIHAAAYIDDRNFHRLTTEIDQETLELHLKPKIDGLVNIDSVLADRTLSLRVAFSSVATYLGGIGYLGYVAANCALDTLIANFTERLGSSWIAIGWDVWHKDSFDGTDGLALGSSLQKYAMNPASATDCLLLSAGLNNRHIYVASSDLAKRKLALNHLLREQKRKSTEQLELVSSDSIEAHIRASWRQAIGATDIQENDRFSALGGDSLSAISAMIALNRSLSSEIPLSEILLAASFGDFCQRVAGYVQGTSKQAKTLNAPAAEISTSISTLQERWFDMAKRGFGFLEMPVRIKGALDIDAFQRAYNYVVTRHQIFGCIYRTSAEGIKQHLANDWSPELMIKDLRKLPTEGVLDVLRAAALNAGTGFDLEHVPPLRSTLFRLADDDSIFFLETHHIAFDGWSSTIFVNDLDKTYTAFQNNSLPELLPARQYSEFTAQQAQYLDSAEYHRAVTHWRKEFHGYNAPNRFVGPDQSSTDRRGAKLRFCITQQQLDGLKSFSKARGQPLFNLLVAAYVHSLRKFTGEDDLVIGTTSHGRNLPGLENVIGVFVNPMPLRFQPGPDLSLLSSLDKVDDVLQGYRRHQNIWLKQVTTSVEPFVGMDLNETFKAYILYQNYYKSVNSSSDLQYEMVEVEDNIADPLMRSFQSETMSVMRDLELIIYEQSEGLSINLWYRMAVYSFEDAQEIGKDFLESLMQMVEEELK